jgi:hypothetical protein
MRTFVLALCLVAAGCNKSSGSDPTAPATGDTAGASAAGDAPAGPLKLTKDTVVVKWTGRWEQGATVMSVTNDGPDTLKHIQMFIYAYDKSGKQLGAPSNHEFWDFDVPKGATKEVVRGASKDSFPAGTEVIEVGVTAVGFKNGVKAADLSFAPDKRPMGGGAPAAAAAAPAAADGAATSAAPAGAADYTDLTGAWISDWGGVKIDGNKGSYTDTYGTGPGRLEFTKTGDHAYACNWGESKKRHGTMNVTLSKDGRKLTGKWFVDGDSTIGKKGGGPINWIKK